MNKFLRIFKTPAFQVGLVLIIIKYFYDRFLGRDKELLGDSFDPLVKDSIHKLDSAFNQYGTDEDLVFSVFKSLDKRRLNLLFKDFGYRYYNDITGKYILFQFLKDNSVSRKLNLKSIIYREMSQSDIDVLKGILSSKGYLF